MTATIPKKHPRNATRHQKTRRTQPQDPQRAEAEGPRPHRESARARTRHAHDDRHQHPLRTGRSRPGPQCRRHRRHAPAGSARSGSIQRHRPQPPSPQAASALPRIRPRPEHRLQHPRRRQADRTPRTAAQRRGLPRCPGSRTHPRPHHRRRLLPPLLRGRCPGLDGRHQSDRGRGSGPSSRRSSSTRRSWTPMAPSSAPTPSASREWTSPTTAAGVIIRCWSRWPTRPSRCSWSIAAATAPRRSGPTSTWTRPIDLCRRAGFRKILLRGDTKFTQTKHLDRWDDAGDIRFVFGIEAHETLKARADDLPAEAYSFLERPPRYQIKTAPRQKPERVKPRDRPASAATRRSTCSRRWSPSSTIGRSPARRAIG